MFTRQYDLRPCENAEAIHMEQPLSSVVLYKSHSTEYSQVRYGSLTVQHDTFQASAQKFVC